MNQTKKQYSGEQHHGKDFFLVPALPQQRQYEALRSFFVDGIRAASVADNFGYRLLTLYSMIRDFKETLVSGNTAESFFSGRGRGRTPSQELVPHAVSIIALRKQYLSIADIKVRLDAAGIKISESYIWSVLNKAGFGRLPRRRVIRESDQDSLPVIPAARTVLLEDVTDEFSTAIGGMLIFMHFLCKYGIDKAIDGSSYPETTTIPRLNSILCFVALKLSNFSRYSHDDQWCMDRGLGLFAGMNVLPKTAWFSSYSFRVTHDMNLNFLKSLNRIWKRHGLLDGSICLDFTSIPCWGDDAHLENNWSGKRNQALASILAALAHSPDSGIISYGNACVRHENEADVVLEFLDFYRSDGGASPRYIVFDSKFTTYGNLAKLDAEGVKFATIRRRGKNIVEELDRLQEKEWVQTRVECAGGKTRLLKIRDSRLVLKGYDREIRQIAITGNGKIKPALLITNDFDAPASNLIRTYTRRWLVEKTIAEQIYFFHLNKVSSSIVIKVDFDLTISILTHNLYRLMAMELVGFENCAAEKIFMKYIANGAKVQINAGSVTVALKKKRNLPALLELTKKYENNTFPWIGDRKLHFTGDSIS